MERCMDEQRITLPAPGVRSLCWHGEELVDWVSGGRRYPLDGSSMVDPHVRFAYRFDVAAVSPSGRYACIYERLGTKGLLVREGSVLREIDRSYYCANAYDYPLVLFALPDGREVLAHCPNEYNRLEIEDLETGRRLTARSNEQADDFFHSRLAASPDGRRLLSAGWIWHPFDTVSFYGVEEALAEPGLLDALSGFPERSVEVNSAAFLSSRFVALTSAPDADNFNDEDDAPDIRPGTISVYDLEAGRVISVAPHHEPVGEMMPLGEEAVVGFYGHPKVIDLRTGAIMREWPELETGQRNSSITWSQQKPMPPLALDPANRRFAVADGEAITVITVT
jgi:hypothetical protein